MPEAPQPNPNQQIDPFFNPVVAETWGAPDIATKQDMPAPEVLTPISQDAYWQHLRNERQISTVDRMQKKVSSSLQALSTTLKRSDMLPIEQSRDYIGIGHSTGVYSGSLLELRYLGVLDTFLQHEGKKIDTELGGSELVIDRTYGKGPFDIKFGSKEQIYAIEEDLRSARAKNEMLQTTQLLVDRKTNDANGDILENVISIEDDPLTFATILSSLGLSVDGYSINLDGIKNVSDLQALYADKIRNALQRDSSLIRKVYDTQDPSKLVGYEWNLDGQPSCHMYMLADDSVTQDQDFSKIKWHLGWSIDKEVASLEQANQSPYTIGEAFLDRPSGVAMVELLSKNGLKFSNTIETFAIDESDTTINDRYGGIYTELSRELAKCINDGNLERLFNIFDLVEGNDTLEELTDRLKIFSAQISENPSVALLQDIIGQLITRDTHGNVESSIPISSGRVEIRDGACFDVAGYYAGALETSDGLVRKNIGDTEFIYKTHGAKTYMNKEPVTVKGINLPIGSLFAQASDGGLVFQRFTPYNFESREDMVDAFGTEVIKAEENNRVNLENAAKRILH